jgi:hypothetical protein
MVLETVEIDYLGRSGGKWHPISDYADEEWKE